MVVIGKLNDKDNTTRVNTYYRIINHLHTRYYSFLFLFNLFLYIDWIY